MGPPRAPIGVEAGRACRGGDGYADLGVRGDRRPVDQHAAPDIDSSGEHRGAGPCERGARVHPAIVRRCRRMHGSDRDAPLGVRCLAGDAACPRGSSLGRAIACALSWSRSVRRACVHDDPVVLGEHRLHESEQRWRGSRTGPLIRRSIGVRSSRDRAALHVARHSSGAARRGHGGAASRRVRALRLSAGGARDTEMSGVRFGVESGSTHALAVRGPARNGPTIVSVRAPA